MLFSGPTLKFLASFYRVRAILLFTFGGKSMQKEHQAWQEFTRYGKIRISSSEVLPTSKFLQATEIDEFNFRVSISILGHVRA